MKVIKPYDALYSIAVKAPMAIISAGIDSIKAGSRMPTFLYSLAIIALLWAVGLLFGLQLEWAGLSQWTVMMTMCLVLFMITVFSMFPATIYAAFTWREKERARQHTLAELRHHNMQAWMEEEVNKCFDTIYDAETYRIPVPSAIFAMLVGWGLFFFSEGQAPVAELARSGMTSGLLVGLGNAHPVVFGFLGAFFFSLQMLFHRYLTTDLKASVFMHIAVRTWVVFILTMVLSVIWPSLPASGGNIYWGGPALPAVCFIAGIVPDVALDLIKKSARASLGQMRLLSYSHIPLARIQGLNLWHQTRLTEEGIDCVQNLAMSDIVGLIVNTRLGLMRLLHWVDQALLCVHVGDDLEKFRKAGIRTATDFESIYMGLPQPEQKRSEREREAELEAKMGREERNYVPAVPPVLAEALAGDRELVERVRNEMIAVCNDANFQRLQTMRSRQLPVATGPDKMSG